LKKTGKILKRLCPVHQTAKAVITLIETLGAGDMFNTAFIAMLLRQNTTAQALKFACYLAASKCCQFGFDALNIPR